MPAYRILVVEDDPLMTAMLERNLSAHFRVAVAGHGLEALAWLEAHQEPVAILLDLQMPVMNGLEFLAAVHKLVPQTRPRRIAVVVLAADPPSSLFDVPRVTYVLIKPYVVTDLVEVLLFATERAFGKP